MDFAGVIEGMFKRMDDAEVQEAFDEYKPPGGGMNKLPEEKAPDCLMQYILGFENERRKL